MKVNSYHHRILVISLSGLLGHWLRRVSKAATIKAAKSKSYGYNLRNFLLFAEAPGSRMMSCGPRWVLLVLYPLFYFDQTSYSGLHIMAIIKLLGICYFPVTHEPHEPLTTPSTTSNTRCGVCAVLAVNVRAGVSLVVVVDARSSVSHRVVVDAED